MLQKKKSIEYDYIVHNISEDDEGATYKAYVPAIACVVFGDNLEEIEDGVRFSIETEMEERKKEKRPMPSSDRQSSFSGKFVLRIDPLIHERLALEAKARGKSLNAYVEEKLDQ